MSMLKNLKSLFIIEEEGGQKPAPKPAKPSAKAHATAEAPPRPHTGTPASQSKGQVTEQFTDILLKAMEGANLEGFDYLEYKRSMQSLLKMNMDDATRYQSAFAMAQTMGATPAHLIDSAQHYLDTLKAEEEKFEAALNHQREKQIAAKQQELDQLQGVIKNKEEKIRQLQAEIKQHEQSLTGLEQDIKEATAKVESTKNDFIASYDNLVEQISADMENMKRHLK